MGAARLATRLFVAASGVQWAGGACPGLIHVEGHGPVALVSAFQNKGSDPAGEVSMKHHTGIVSPHLKGRAYFADTCQDGVYNNNDYASLKLLGKRLSYTTDLSGAGCGCNGAFYLTAMRHNDQLGDCSDYYCDASSVCGVSCSEVDIQEANQFAWHSTFRLSGDGHGVKCGVGGDTLAECKWKIAEYGRNGTCIDTSRPFRVTVSFPVDRQGILKAMDVLLLQEGRSCPLTISMDRYDAIGGQNGIVKLSEELARGMTPVISYWASDDMLWLDGLDQNGEGHCLRDDASACADAVKFYDFSVASLEASPPEDGARCVERCPVGSCDKTLEGSCTWFYGEYESFHCQVEHCGQVPVGESFSKCWSWDDRYYYSIKDYNYPCPNEKKILDLVQMLIRPEVASPPVPRSFWNLPGGATHLHLSRPWGAVAAFSAVASVLMVVLAALATARRQRATAGTLYAHVPWPEVGSSASCPLDPTQQDV